MEDIEKKLRKIKLKGSLQNHCLKNQLIETVSEKIKLSVPKLENLKLDAELINVVCSCIETLVSKKRTSLNKKEIVLTIWATLYPDITEDELKTIDKTIEFLLSNKLVKKLKNRYFSKILDCFLKND